jgi:dTDP-4-amino-4,6-dideoxygalactose transaminase
MTELQGAVALAQLRKLDSIISRRQSWCGRLSKRIGGLPGLQLPVTQDRGTHSYWFYAMRVDKSTLGADADQFSAAMKAEGVPVAPHYIGKPIYKYPLFQDHSAFEHGDHPFKRIDYKRVSCPTAEAILDTYAILAVNESYSDGDLDETVKAFERVVAWFQSKR